MVVAYGRLPAYSGATVPASDRLPARKREAGSSHVQAAVPGFGNPHAVREKIPMWCLAGAALLTSACAAATQSSVRDGAHAPRIVTLMPSFAEDVCAIGAGAQLAGVSEYTNAPCARGAVRVGNFAAIDAERIVALHPDAVMAIPAQRVLTAPLQRAGIRIVFAPDDSLHDIFLDIRTAGRITAHAVQASALVARLQRETAALRASERGVRRPSVFVVVQARPIWTVGPTSYISTLLQLAGARNAVTALARPYAQYNAEALVRLQPDAVVAASDLQSLLDGQPWISLRAVRQHHVFFLSDPDILERPGPRYNDGLRWLIARLRPLSR